MGLKGMAIINALARTDTAPLPERIVESGDELRLARSGL
jgi:hypothetical protein